MAKLKTLTSADENVIKSLTRLVEKDMAYHMARYQPSMTEEFQYLVKEGFYDSVAEAIAEDLYFSNELYSKEDLQKATALETMINRKAF